MMERRSLLPAIRVLDLADEKGWLCGRVLSDLGADVVKIERPGGDPGRNIGPFYHDIPDGEKSLYWFAFNGNKRGITLNIETADGRDILKRLVRAADILVESFPPGYMEGLGLGYPALSEVNLRLIMVSISPFGQEGPRRDYRGFDIVAAAMSGFMFICGDADRPPVRPSGNQAYLSAAADGAVGAMVAYYHREVSGRGQHVDISMQESLLPVMTPAIPVWEAERFHLGRYGAYRRLGAGELSRMVWPCKDGYVVFVIHGGALGAPTNRALAAWMEREGALPDFMREMDWDKLDLVTISKERLDLVERHVGEFFMRHTKAELYDWAFREQVMLYPVSNVKDLAENDQLRERGFWTRIEHAELGEAITYPGAWAKSSEADMDVRCRAPLIGEHNRQVYEGELGMKREELVMLREAGVI